MLEFLESILTYIREYPILRVLVHFIYIFGVIYFLLWIFNGPYPVLWVPFFIIFVVFYVILSIKLNEI